MSVASSSPRIRMLLRRRLTARNWAASRRNLRRQRSFASLSSTMPSASSSRRWYFAVLASLPTIVWIRDTFVDIMRVEGSSMEPTLQAGDWILVRKCEPGWTTAWVFGNNVADDTTTVSSSQQDEQREKEEENSSLRSQESSNSSHDSVNELSKRATSSDSESQAPSGSKRRFLSPLEVALLKSKIQHYERMMARINHMSGASATSSSSSFAWFYHSTPLVVPGQVVVLKSPEHFSEQHIKRIVAVGGQWLQQPAIPSLLSMNQNNTTSRLPHYGREGRNRGRNSDSNSPGGAAASWSTSTTHRRRPGSRLQLLPPYTLYVEGDHSRVSRDSRQYGPISRNLLCGTAEAIIWPPQRWQRLAVAATPTVQGRPRAFWQ